MRKKLVAVALDVYARALVLYEKVRLRHGIGDYTAQLHRIAGGGLLGRECSYLGSLRQLRESFDRLTGAHEAPNQEDYP
jgi:hypothetical protein